MRTYRIAVIPGDGIGQEIAPVAVEVLQHVAERSGLFNAEYEYFPWGSDYYLQRGMMMPEDGLETLRAFDAIYFGAVGSPQVADHTSLHGLRLRICQGFDQYANVRPTVLLPGINGPLRGKGPEDINFVVVRENTEGEYIGAGGRAHQGLDQEVAVETAIFSRFGISRIMRFAFDLARQRPRKHLCSVTKSNAQQHTLRLWDEIFEELSADYPDVTTERVLVDAMAARMVLKPETLDVLVASNLFADILTDLGGAIGGSLGLAPSGNLNPERVFPSMFEPIHGSAPDIFGKGIANPTGMLLCGAMLLEHLGEPQAASLVTDAVKAVTATGSVHTPDIGGTATTVEFGTAVMVEVDRLSNEITM
jgi:tartrate dehydrogenase/decarboxylase/D-malate dehydrogenase